MTEDGAVPPRERGWWGPILTLVLVWWLVSESTTRLILPVIDLMLLLAPACAGLAIIGWRSGGRLSLAVLWSLFAIWVVTQGSRSDGAFGAFAVGWSVALGIGFTVILGMTPGQHFLSRALRTLAVVGGVSGAALLGWRGGPSGVLTLVRTESATRAAAARAEWETVKSSPEFAQLPTDSEGGQWYVKLVELGLETWPDVGLRFFPALLVLQSLLVLALAWAVYHRVGRERVGPPLSALREFRFDESLVWGVVLGLLCLAVPLGEAGRVLGLNLLVVFGALCALRGLGVMVWFLAPGRVMAVLLTLFILLFWPYIMLAAAGLGLGDTWFDWRRSPRQQSQRSE